MANNKRKVQKAAKNHPKLFLALAIIVFCIVAVIVVLYVLEIGPFKHKSNGGGGGNELGEGTVAEVSEADLSIHFLELGNKYTGDCTLIKCGNTEVLIDAGSRQNSATTIKSYVDQYCTDGVLEYVIATHAHQDHIAGFVGSNSGNTKTGILYQYKVGTLIQFAGTNTTSQIYNNYLTAVEYAKEQGATVYTAKQCWYETDGAKKTYYLDDAHKISLNILYQRYYDELDKDDENNYSVCTLLTQVTENKTYNYLFTGDLEAEGESSLVENNSLPEVELFKGGHHGSYTASTEKLLSVIKPKNVAVCCCCGTTEYTSNKDNTFPAQAFIDRVSKYTENVYCTTLMIDYKAGTYESMNGNIVFYYKKEESGGALKLYCSNNSTILKDTEWFKQNRVWKG
ncbi:MAG: MBL fold metallo-hydrolase [Clostridia bacterium]|nr:MBL fold metallo-hydrolase [Clostridia bacterium]